MPYVLVCEDPASASARLVSPALFPTRGAALEALQGLVASEPELSVARLFVCDLDLASPVLLVATAGPSGDQVSLAEGPMTGLETATPEIVETAGRPAEASVVPGSSEPLAAEAGEPGEPRARVFDSEGPLAEGAVPELPLPEVPEPEPAFAEAPEPAEVVPEAPAVEEPASVEAPWWTGVTPEAAETTTEAEEGTSASDEWPAETSVADAEVLAAISSLEAATAEAAGAEAPLQATAEETGTSPEPGAIAGPAAWPWTEQAVSADEEEAAEPFVPADASGHPEQAEALGAPSSAETSPEEPGEIEEGTAAGPSEASQQEQGAPVPEAGGEEVAPSGLAGGEGQPQEAESEYLPPGYEFAGDLDLAAYTCEDCIYVNTCPRAGESTPAECGSFQWRSA